MVPAIDVHTHIFNAMDIPLEGYLRSRRSDAEIREEILSFLGPLLYPHLVDGMRDRCIWKEPGQNKMGPLYRLILKAAQKLRGEQYFEWEDTLTKDVSAIASEMVETYMGIDLYVPLMVDFEYWFKNTQDNLISEQINDVFENIVIPFKGMIHPFVPFDPVRELTFRCGMLNPDGNEEKHGALQLVKDAIEKQGFIGVKVYNPMGYRPFNNKEADKQRKRVAVRNEKMHYLFNGDDIDGMLSELYDYCVTNGVPITAHCLMRGIESYPDASFDFAQAAFWRDVLNQDRYKDLHVNLAHFGWYTPGGYQGKICWTKDICEMLEDYEYLYTDVSCHRVTIRKTRREFKSDYKKICKDYPLVKKRLLYGSDWHVLKRVRNYKDFKRRYIDVLKHGNLFSDEEIEDFLGGNALKFLGLLPGEKNRQRIKTFYDTHGIEEPHWFKASANL